jgi:hypothetical protein
MTTRKKSKGINLKPYFIGIGILLCGYSLYLGYRIFTADKILIPISVFAIIAGLFFEAERVTRSWGTIIGIAILSFFLSFFVFLPGEGGYFLNRHIEMWPYAFCLFFIVLSITFAGDKVIPKLTEGITLMQSVAIIYWVIDSAFLGFTHIYLIPFIILFGLYFAGLSFYHGFSYDKLKRTTRLRLSIWSSIIMLLLGVENIYSVYQNPAIENTDNLVYALYIAAQFFLLGISSIYIVQNYFMLAEFIPTRERFFNETYYKELNKLKKKHIDRYSQEQVSKLDSLLCVLITGTIYGLNYYFHFVPRNFIIWIVFVLFPIIINLFERLSNHNLQASQASRTDL